MKTEASARIALLFAHLVSKRMATGDSLDQARAYALDTLRRATGSVVSA